MSATNRLGLPRHDRDFYETPRHAIDLLLAKLGITSATDAYIIDPGSGVGAIASRIAEVAPKASVRGIEIHAPHVEQCRQTRENSVAWECADWLAWRPDGPPDYVIGNPPYGPKSDINLAEKFIRQALDVVGKKGIVAMLLRATYLIPKRRSSLREKFGLPERWDLERRPSFNGSGTDACDYSWHVWGRGKSGGKWCVLR